MPSLPRPGQSARRALLPCQRSLISPYLHISISPCLKGRGSAALLVATTLADERATSLAEARTAVEADLKTREGKTRKAGKRVHGETSRHDEAVEAARGKRSGKLLDTHETRQRRRGEGSSVASCDQDGRVRQGGATQESTFSPPPRTAYRVSGYMKLTHRACRKIGRASCRESV